jgi:2-methylisocitrate lyase-like PEP mutase family enzyme
LKADTFKKLHLNPKKLLILPNVWDVAGARIVESLGAKAVATTSGGVAWSLGYRDGNHMPARLQARLAEEIVQVVKIPVSVDFEAGYSNKPSAVAENLKPLADAGISGINIEDGTDDPTLLAKKIEAIKKLTSSLGVDLFINTRTDVYLQDLVPDSKKVKETLERAAIYRAAGADGLFVPGLTDNADIAQITEGTELPVNLMSSPDLPNADELAKLNVRRLSAGIAVAQIIYKHLARLADNFLKTGDSKVFGEDALQYSDLQGLFPEKHALTSKLND